MTLKVSVLFLIEISAEQDPGFKLLMFHEQSFLQVDLLEVPSAFLAIFLPLISWRGINGF
jgi:hypothetical protein